MRTVGERGVDIGIEARAAATALRSMQGTCTSPQTGSHVSPRWCSRPISAAYSICEGVPPKSWHEAAAAMRMPRRLHPAAHFGSRDRRVGLGDVAEEPGGRQRAQDADPQEVAGGGQV